MRECTIRTGPHSRHLSTRESQLLLSMSHWHNNIIIMLIQPGWAGEGKTLQNSEKSFRWACKNVYRKGWRHEHILLLGAVCLGRSKRADTVSASLQKACVTLPGQELHPTSHLQHLIGHPTGRKSEALQAVPGTSAPFLTPCYLIVVSEKLLFLAGTALIPVAFLYFKCCSQTRQVSCVLTSSVCCFLPSLFSLGYWREEKLGKVSKWWFPPERQQIKAENKVASRKIVSLWADCPQVFHLPLWTAAWTTLTSEWPEDKDFLW